MTGERVAGPAADARTDGGLAGPGLDTGDPAGEEPLAVEADLQVSVDGRRVDVWSEDGGAVVVVSVPDFRTARALFGGAERLPADLDWAGIGLDSAGVTVEVRVRHATVARAGRNASPGALAVLADRPEVELDAAGVAVALARRLF